MSGESVPVFIDLGLERGEPDSYVHRGRSGRPAWWAIGFLAVLVLVCGAASAPPAKSPLSDVLRLTVGPADSIVLAGGGTLLAQTYGQLAAYDLSDGRMRWQAAQATSAFRMRLTNHLVLLRPWSAGRGDPGTVAVSVADGVPQWERAGNVVTVGGSDTLLAVKPWRAVGGANRRVEGPIDAVDPLTGRTRWTVAVPSRGVLLGVPGPADSGTRMLIMHADRTMALHDLDTGERIAAATVPAADYGTTNPAVAGGIVLLRHPGTYGMELSAFDPVTLRTLWTAPVDGVDQIKECGVLACLVGAAGVRAIDPATGDQRWSHPGWLDIDVQGEMTVAYRGNGDTDPAAVVDPATGRTEVDLHGWRPVDGIGGGDHLLVTRSMDAGARTMVAVARPGDLQPRLLAQLPAGTGDCQAAPTRLICRSSGGQLVVWAYREG